MALGVSASSAAVMPAVPSSAQRSALDAAVSSLVERAAALPLAAPAQPPARRGTAITWSPAALDATYTVAWAPTAAYPRAMLLPANTALLPVGVIHVWLVRGADRLHPVGPFVVNNCATSTARIGTLQVQSTPRCEIRVSAVTPAPATPQAAFRFANLPTFTTVYVARRNVEMLLGTVDGAGDLDPRPRQAAFMPPFGWLMLGDLFNPLQPEDNGTSALFRFSLPGQVTENSLVAYKANVATALLFLGLNANGGLVPRWPGVGVQLSVASVTGTRSGLTISANLNTPIEVKIQTGANLAATPYDYLQNARAALTEWNNASSAIDDLLGQDPTGGVATTFEMADNTGSWVGRYVNAMNRYLKANSSLMNYLQFLPYSAAPAQSQMSELSLNPQQGTGVAYAALMDQATNRPTAYVRSAINKIAAATAKIKAVDRQAARQDRLQKLVIAVGVIGAAFGLYASVCSAVNNFAATTSWFDLRTALSNLTDLKGVSGVTVMDLTTLALKAAGSNIATSLHNVSGLMGRASDDVGRFATAAKLGLSANTPAPVTVDAYDVVKDAQDSLLALESQGIDPPVSSPVTGLTPNGTPITLAGAIKDLYLAKENAFRIKIGGLVLPGRSCDTVQQNTIESLIIDGGPFDRRFERRYSAEHLVIRVGGPRAVESRCQVYVLLLPRG